MRIFPLITGRIGYAVGQGPGAQTILVNERALRIRHGHAAFAGNGQGFVGTGADKSRAQDLQLSWTQRHSLRTKKLHNLSSSS